MRGLACDAALVKYAKSRTKPKTKYAKRLFAVIENKWKWRIVAAQVVVGSQESGYATAIDCICQDKDGKAIAIELKCAFGDKITEAQGNLRLGKVRKKYESNPLNQAKLQLLAGILLLHKQTKLRIKGAYVVQVTDTHVRKWPISKSFHKDWSGPVARAVGVA